MRVAAHAKISKAGYAGRRPQLHRARSPRARRDDRRRNHQHHRSHDDCADQRMSLMLFKALMAKLGERIQYMSGDDFEKWWEQDYQKDGALLRQLIKK